MRVALLADIHSNLLAYEAVLKALPAYAPDLTLILGDLVGYGAEPREVIKEAQRSGALVVAGNHDVDALKDVPLDGTHQAARNAQTWTRTQLGPDDASYLRSLPNIRQFDFGLVGVHGCYLNDSYYKGYVTGSMVEYNMRVVAKNPSWPVLACCGHTHTPLFAYLAKDQAFEPRTEEEHQWPPSSSCVLVNPGSVGQPRDGNRCASFAIVDIEDRRVRFVRVPYDVEEASRRILRVGLPEENGLRLLEGR